MVSQAETIGNLLQNTLLQESLSAQIQTLSNNKQNNNTNYLGELRESSSALPSVLNKDTLQDLVDGKYNLTLEDYTSLTTYNLRMSSLYGNNSANSYSLSSIQNIGQQNTLTNAKAFVNNLKEKGYSNSEALKMYSAYQSYSLFNTLNNLNKFSYVSAKI